LVQIRQVICRFNDRRPVPLRRRKSSTPDVLVSLILRVSAVPLGVATALVMRVDAADATEVVLRRACVPLVKAQLVRARDDS